MERTNAMACGALLFLCFAAAASKGKPVSTPSPAPAPAAPEYVDLAHLLSLAGPFHTFLKYLQSTKLIETFQDQANNTEEGITLFVPQDSAFSSLKTPSLANLTQDQLKSVLSFHAIPHYYSLSDFRNLSLYNPITTFAGGNGFGINFTDNAGTIRIDSGWSRTKITSAVHASDPVAIYETDKVLLPEAIFGTDIPPMPAPAPAPAPAVEEPAADSPEATAADKGKGASSPSSSFKSAAAAAATSSPRGRGVLGYGALMAGVVLLRLC